MRMKVNKWKRKKQDSDGNMEVKLSVHLISYYRPTDGQNGSKGSFRDGKNTSIDKF